MEQYTDRVDTYKKVRVNTAHPGKIIVMLYDEMLRRIDFSIEKMDAGSRLLDEISASVLKAYDIVTELTASLDMEKGGEIATRLHALYEFFGTELIKANVKKNSMPLKSIRPLIAELRDSWHTISRSPDAAATEQVSGVDLSG